MASDPRSGPTASRFQSNPNSRPISHPGLDRPANDASSSTTKPGGGVVQPKPQALPKRSGPSSIIVSMKQKGNPVLTNIKNMPWEYGDIAADYQIGLTACALFLSLKYHRLHPEYIYMRIKNLQGKYALRIILTLVDIDNHEASLRELSKTSVINNVTIILCWSAAEGARYLEQFKSLEGASPSAIRQHQSTTYADRMVDFVTTPRAVNKTDAVALVSQFGTLRTAVNARHEDVATIAGWGEKKVQQWCASVREPFRVARAGKHGLDLERLNLVSTQAVDRTPTLSRDVTRVQEAEGDEIEDAAVEQGPSRPAPAAAAESSLFVPDDFADDEEAMMQSVHSGTTTGAANEAPADSEAPHSATKRKPVEDPLSDGLMAALSKLRKPS